jgi:hypothetical protein
MAFTNTAAAQKALALNIPIWPNDFTADSGSQNQYLSHRATLVALHLDHPPA